MNSLKEKFKDAFEQKSSKTKILVAVGIIGILLILLSEISLPKSKQETEVTKTDYTAYVNELDEKLNNLISSIDGVGTCKVMITLKSTSESVYAKNIQNSQSDSSASQNSEYVIYDGKDGDTPILIQENFPEIEGIAIVCNGGDNIAVREKVIQCISSLFNISSNRISVSKLGNTERR
ncbi:MAG: hypothetical protein K2K01_06220 [Eubacterium sp.]|nr:hypothetical protein [Eubacterium sp.]